MSRRRTLNKGIVFVVSAPSGAGKTTLVTAVMDRDRRLAKTVSHTTRPRRTGERRGRDYFFVTPAEFNELIRSGAFVEWMEIYGHKYGTSRQAVSKALKAGKDAVLVIEERGARRIKAAYGEGAVFILVLPPSLRELRRRIEGRGAESGEAVRKRTRSARQEVKAMRWYDYVLVNDEMASAVDELHSIIRAERARMSRNAGELRRMY